MLLRQILNARVLLFFLEDLCPRSSRSWLQSSRPRIHCAIMNVRFNNGGENGRDLIGGKEYWTLSVEIPNARTSSFEHRGNKSSRSRRSSLTLALGFRSEFRLGKRLGKKRIFPPGKKRIGNREKLGQKKSRTSRTISRISKN